MMVNIRAGVVAGFVNACAVPRGTGTNVPGLIAGSWSGKRIVSSPFPKALAPQRAAHVDDRRTVLVGLVDCDTKR
jgi:hypothetical protein